MMAALLPTATPPAIVLKIINLKFNLPLMMQVRLTVVATHAEMQYIVLSAAL
jgi:hypothetical protein